MRPRSEIRQAVASVTQRLHAQGTEPTWREIAQHVPGIDLRSPADARLVRMTMENMLRAGELERAGRRMGDAGNRPMVAVRPPRAGWVRQGSDLDGVLRAWRVG